MNSANHLTTRSSSRTRIHLITFVEKNHQDAMHEARRGLVGFIDDWYLISTCNNKGVSPLFKGYFMPFLS